LGFLQVEYAEAAKVLGVSRPTFSTLLNARAALSPEVALRVEKAFGPKMDTLLRMQTACEIVRTISRSGLRRNKPRKMSLLKFSSAASKSMV